MKKYKLHNQNLLTEHIMIAKGLNGKYNLNLHLVSLAVLTVSQGVRFFVDNKNNIPLLFVFLSSLGVNWYCIGTYIFDSMKVPNSKKRLSDLENILKEKNIDVSFSSATVCDDSTVLLNNECFIKYYDEDDIVFYNMDNIRGLDITYDVKKCLMKKRKFKKYVKSIS